MKIERFEELQSWQEARKLVKIVYDAIRNNPKLAADIRFCGQISSASVSSMSNIAEGFAKETDKEFTRGLWISKGSGAEVQSLSYAAIDQDYISEKEFKIAMELSDKTVRKISGLMNYLKRSNLKGYKYH